MGEGTEDLKRTKKALYVLAAVFAVGLLVIACKDEPLAPRPQFVIDPTCCPADAPSGCGCPPGGATGAPDTVHGNTIYGVCPSSVERAATITCAVYSSVPGEPAQVSQWSFRDTSGTFSYVRTFNPTDTTWSGRLVQPGFIKVIGHAAGHVPEILELQVAASPRDWSAKNTFGYLGEENPNNLPADLRDFEDFGRTEPLFFPVSPNELGSDARQIADGGPNHDLWYFEDLPPFRDSITIRINYNALSIGSPFYGRQFPHDSIVTSAAGDTTYCGQDYILPAFLTLVQRHEGIHDDFNSHAYIYRHSIDDELVPFFEGYGRPRLEFPDIMARLYEIENVAYEDTRAMDGDDRNILNTEVHCIMRGVTYQ